MFKYIVEDGWNKCHEGETNIRCVAGLDTPLSPIPPQFFLKDFIYVRAKVREADSPLSRESDVGLNPRTLRS